MFRLYEEDLQNNTQKFLDNPDSLPNQQQLLVAMDKLREVVKANLASKAQEGDDTVYNAIVEILDRLALDFSKVNLSKVNTVLENLALDCNTKAISFSPPRSEHTQSRFQDTGNSQSVVRSILNFFGQDSKARAQRQQLREQEDLILQEQGRNAGLFTMLNYLNVYVEEKQAVHTPSPQRPGGS